MNLLEKAKVITTPTAYSDGILHSVKPVENLGSELISSFTNGTTYPLDTFVSSGNNITSLIKSSGFAGCVSNGNTFVLGDKIKVSFSYTKNSGNDLRVVFSSVVSGAGAQISNAETISSSGEYSFTFTITSSATGYLQFGTGNASHSINASITNISAKKIIGADFTFTRNSSATRVGEDGYIQDLQIIGGELTQNGDFEQIGSEQIINGNFDTDSDWVKGTGWSIADGKASCDGTQTLTSTLRTYVGISGIQNKPVLISFEVKNYSAGFLNATLEGTGQYDFSSISSDGVYQTTSTSTDALPKLKFDASADFIGSIDNVSVKEVGQNWTLNTNNNNQWSIAEGQKASYAATATDFIITSNVLTIGRKYRASLDILDTGGSTIRLSVNSAVGGSFVDYSLGDSRYTTEFIAATNYLRIGGSSSGASFSVDNVSVKEVTDDTNLPRINYEGFDYDNGLPIYGSGKGHLLLEGQSTNNLTYSENFATNWTTYASTISTDNSTLSPDGETNGTLVSKNGQTFARIERNISLSSNPYTFSVFAKKGLTNWVKVRTDGSAFGEVSFDLENGIVGTNSGATSATIEDYGNGWYRCAISLTASITICRLYVADIDNGWGNTNAASAYFWGAMVEEGNISSYIPTNGSAVTRAAETCNNAGNADLFDSEGVLYAEIAALANDGTNRMISISDGTNANRITLYYSSITNQIAVIIKQSGITSYQGYYSALSNLDYHKIAIRYKDNDFSFWINGVQVGTGSSGIVPSGLKELAFNYGDNLNFPFYGKTKMVGVFPYLSNDEMECLTGEGYGSFQAMALANNYTII